MDAGRIVAHIEAETANFEKKMAGAQRTFEQTANKMNMAALKADATVKRSLTDREKWFRENVRLNDVQNASAAVAAKTQAQLQREGMAMARAHGAALKIEAARTAAMVAPLNSVSRAAAGAAQNFGKLRGPMTTFASALIPLPAGVTRFSSALGGLALGGAVMVPVLAGLAALAFAWDRITKGAREAKKAQEEALERAEQIGKQRRQGFLGDIPSDIASLERQRAKLFTELNTLKTVSTSEGLQVTMPRTAGELEKLRQKYVEVTMALADLNTERQILTGEHEEEAARKAEAAAERMRAAAEKVRKEWERVTEAVKDIPFSRNLAGAGAHPTLVGGIAREIETVNARILAMQAAQRAALAVVGGAGRPSTEPTVEELDRRIAQFQLLQEAAKLTAATMADAFASIVSGSESVGQAFKRMVQSIIADLARLAAQRALTDLFARVLGSLPSVAGLAGAPGPNTPVTVVSPGATRQSVIVQQSITFAPSFIDTRGAAAFLKEQSNTIRQVVAEGTQQSAAYARMLKGR